MLEDFYTSNKPKYDPETGRRVFDINIRNIKNWSDAAGAVSVKSWNYAREVHEDKLSRLRDMKEYF